MRIYTIQKQVFCLKAKHTTATNKTAFLGFTVQAQFIFEMSNTMNKYLNNSSENIQRVVIH